MSVITKDLGVATAYGYAKSKGYTGTEEEFAELMASYADVAQQAEAAAQDAEDAKDAAITAKTAAQTAQTAAESAQTAAAGSAQTASTKASEASNSAQTAAGSATAAQTSATAASGSAQTAQTAAQTATTKASEASSSASAASTAKTGAETARTGAQTAQTAAETAQANAEAAASSVSASAAQIEQNTEEIGALKNDLNQFPNGTYPNMSVGNADQLTATVGIEDKTPYLFRTSGGSVDIGDRETVNKIVGGTIVNNQLFPFESDSWTLGDLTISVTNGKLTASGTATSTGTTTLFPSRIYNTLKLIKGHVYFLYFLGDYNFEELRYVIYGTVNQGINLADKTSKVFKSNVDNCTDSEYVISVTSGTTYSATFDTSLVDLTKDYGTSIADYVLSLETATAGAGVAWLKKHFPKQFDSGYQAYDAGSMQSVSGLTAHKMVGFNAWDEVVEIGAINHSTGENVSGNVTIRSKNYIPCIPSMTYYFENLSNAGSPYVHYYDANKNFLSYTEVTRNTTFVVPSDAHYIRFNMDTGYGTTYNHDICINFHWDGEKDGTYEPYKTWSYALDDSVVIRGIPKIDANGNLYYDGDEYLPDGTVNRRYKTIVIDEDSNISTGTSGMPFRILLNDFKRTESVQDLPLAISDKLVGVTQGSTWGIPFTFSLPINNAYLYFKLSDDILTIEDAKTYLTSNPVTVLYEKQIATTETALPYQATQIVDDWGTEEYVLSDGAFPVPVGHDTMYQNNLRAKLEMSPESPDGDGLYVVQQESGENTYVPLASTATIQDILTRLTALENA